MRMILAALIGLLALASAAIAQPGPGPTPQPWIVSGATISYNNGGITMPQSVTGGTKGVGTINVRTGYYLAGNAIAWSASSPLVLNATTGNLTCPTCAITGSVVTSVSNSDGSLTISPTTGAVIASLNPAHANTWTAVQTISLNSGSLPTAQTGTVFRIANANATTTRFQLDAFGAQAFLTTACAGGTAAAPTTLTAATQCGGYNLFGYDGTAWGGPAATIRTFANQNWAVGAHGSYIEIATTPNGSTTLGVVCRFENDAGVTCPNTVTGGSKGAGTINATGLYIAGVAVTSAGITSLTGDVTATGPGAAAATLATVNGNVGTFGSATQSVQFTVNAKGLITAAANVTVTPAVGSITGLGTGVATALAINVGTAGSFVVNGGALGSPSSAGTLPAFTLGGTISGGGNQINNVIIGTTTPLAGSFTTLSASGQITSTVSTGTAPFVVASTTQVANLNAATAGSATNATNTTNIAITDDTTTNATMDLVWVTTNTGNLPAKVSSTKFNVNPSTGVLGATIFDASTGFRIAGAATSTNYLRGNGTNFVSSAIQAGDLPLASSSAFGAVKVDNTTITASGGVITAIGSAATAITVGTTTVGSGSSGNILYNNAGVLGELTIATAAQTQAATANKIIDAAVLSSAGALTTLTDAATIAVDMATLVNATVTLGGNRTLGAPSNTQVGRTGCIYVVQDGTGSRTLAYNAVWKFAGGVAPTLTTTASAADMLCYTVRTSSFITATLTKDVKLFDGPMPWDVLVPWYKEPANDNERDIDREKAA